MGNALDRMPRKQPAWPPLGTKLRCPKCRGGEVSFECTGRTDRYVCNSCDFKTEARHGG